MAHDLGGRGTMASIRGSYRYPVDLHAWVHAEGRAPVEARVVDLSRTGAGLWVASSSPAGPAAADNRRRRSRRVDRGLSVRLAVTDVVGDRPVAQQWRGRVTHDHPAVDGLRRVGVVFDGQGQAGAVAGADPSGLPWPISVLTAGPDGPVDGPGAGTAGLDAIASAVALAGVVLDQASKAWAWSWSAGAVHLVSDLLAVVPSANAGTVASLADNLPLTPRLCALGALALAAVAPGWAARASDHGTFGGPLPAIGGGLLVAGLVGNATDRLALGYVRDFLVSTALPNWAFNLADVFLVAGAIALLAARRPRPTTSEAAPRPRLT